MGFLRSVGGWLGLTRSETPGPLPGVIPPARSASGTVTAQTALTLPDVYRAIQIHAIAASQLSVDVDRSDETIPTPSLIRQPDLEHDQSRSAWIEDNVVSMGCTGNAFWRLTRSTSTGQVTNAEVLDPHLVTVVKDDRDRKTFRYRGKVYTPREVQHLQLLRVPGMVAGLGPIQAAQASLGGMIDLRNYAGGWFTNGAATPSGVLSTDQPLNSEQAAAYKQAWNDTADGGVRVLGAGLSFTPIMLKPSDAQWLEVQRFNVTGIARLFGVPASLMLAAVEGSSQTYANVEQDWIAYVRFSLMGYLREIEEALTSIIPRGQTARFNIDALLRTDTKTRYDAYNVATGGRPFMRPSEVRQIEKLPPMEGIDDAPAGNSSAAGA